MSLSSPTLPRPTPTVMRVIAVTAVVQLLLETIFTSPDVRYALMLDPAGFLRQPWGAVTYLFVHGGILHLATNMLGLYLFGTAVEARMGSRPFLIYYLYCGIGAALTAVLLNLFSQQAPVIGASGAVLGVAVAFAIFWPDAEILVFPIPFPIKARTLVIGLAVLDLLFAQLVHDGVAHEAHLGGMAAGWLFFRFGGFATSRPPEAPTPRRVVMVQQGVTREAGPRAAPPMRQAAPPRPGNDPVAAEVDRVLDKISEQGIQSLTPDERRFLDEVSKRKQRDIH
jgi:membrane associated rhomboid family serine protease